MITITHKKQAVATITRQHSTDAGYKPAEPWVLQHQTGRIDRFHNLNAAKNEASKTWPGCKFIK